VQSTKVCWLTACRTSAVLLHGWQARLAETSTYIWPDLNKAHLSSLAVLCCLLLMMWQSPLLSAPGPSTRPCIRAEGAGLCGQMLSHDLCQGVAAATLLAAF
jgi:hypothetical protein